MFRAIMATGNKGGSLAACIEMFRAARGDGDICIVLNLDDISKGENAVAASLHICPRANHEISIAGGTCVLKLAGNSEPCAGLAAVRP